MGFCLLNDNCDNGDQNNEINVRMASIITNGLEKINNKFPWVIVKVCCNDCSNRGPRIKARAIGATGKRFLTNIYPMIPETNMIKTSNILICTAYEPSMAKTVIMGTKIPTGTLMTCEATLQNNNPVKNIKIFITANPTNNV